MKVSRKVVCCISILISIFVAIVCLPALISGGVYKGMSYDDFCESHAYASSCRYGSYLFFRDRLGSHVVAYIARSEKITDIHYFSNWRVNSSDEAFSKIRNGMDIYEVVAIVGLPVTSETFGMASLTFQSDSGTKYMVYLSEETSNGNTTLTVSSIVVQDCAQ